MSSPPAKPLPGTISEICLLEEVGDRSIGHHCQKPPVDYLIRSVLLIYSKPLIHSYHSAREGKQVWKQQELWLSTPDQAEVEKAEAERRRGREEQQMEERDLKCKEERHEEETGV